jgi:hypothetical protein
VREADMSYKAFKVGQGRLDVRRFLCIRSRREREGTKVVPHWGSYSHFDSLNPLRKSSSLEGWWRIIT